MVEAWIVTGYGINCDLETEFAFKLAGARTRRVHVNELLSSELGCDILFFPGGFSYGDELGAGKVLANKLTGIMDELVDFVRAGGLIGGHCNGAQVLVKAGLVPALEGYGRQEVTLARNLSNRYEDRWVHVRPVSRKCVWTRGLPLMELPVAHGEGRFFSRDPRMVEKLQRRDQIALVYVRPDGSPARVYPHNPNGSVGDIAGICDPTGRVFAQMPHPERALSWTNHPNWTSRRRESWEGDGLGMFKNVVSFARENL